MAKIKKFAVTVQKRVRQTLSCTVGGKYKLVQLLAIPVKTKIAHAFDAAFAVLKVQIWVQRCNFAFKDTLWERT